MKKWTHFSVTAETRRLWRITFDSPPINLVSPESAVRAVRIVSARSPAPAPVPRAPWAHGGVECVIGRSPEEVETALQQLCGLFGLERSQRPQQLPGQRRCGRWITPEPRAEVRRLPAAGS